MKQRNLMFIFFVFSFLGAAAAHAVTLAELQKLALNNRDVVERYKVNLAISENNTNIARSPYFPSLDLSYTMNALDDSSTFEASNNSNE